MAATLFGFGDEGAKACKLIGGTGKRVRQEENTAKILFPLHGLHFPPPTPPFVVVARRSPTSSQKYPQEFLCRTLVLASWSGQENNIRSIAEGLVVDCRLGMSLTGDRQRFA